MNGLKQPKNFQDANRRLGFLIQERVRRTLTPDESTEIDFLQRWVREKIKQSDALMKKIAWDMLSVGTTTTDS